MIPKSLKPMPKEKAERLIKQHLKDGTGEWKYSEGVGDFSYKTKRGYYMIRKDFTGEYEGGKVCL